MSNPAESTFERNLLELHKLEREIAALQMVARFVKEWEQEEPSRSDSPQGGPNPAFLPPAAK